VLFNALFHTRADSAHLSLAPPEPLFWYDPDPPYISGIIPDELAHPTITRPFQAISPRWTGSFFADRLFTERPSCLGSSLLLLIVLALLGVLSSQGDGSLFTRFFPSAPLPIKRFLLPAFPAALFVMRRCHVGSLFCTTSHLFKHLRFLFPSSPTDSPIEPLNP